MMMLARWILYITAVTTSRAPRMTSEDGSQAVVVTEDTWNMSKL